MLTNPWSIAGLLIALAELDTQSPRYSAIYDKGNFGAADPVEIIEQTNWYTFKIRNAIEGYKLLKAVHGDRVQIRLWSLEMPATVLITESRCYLEPYVNINLQERNLKDMITFEIECDSKAHLFRHCAAHFEFLWRFSEPIDAFLDSDAGPREQFVSWWAGQAGQSPSQLRAQVTLLGIPSWDAHWHLMTTNGH